MLRLRPTRVRRDGPPTYSPTSDDAPSSLGGKDGDTASVVELVDHLAGRESRPVAQSAADRIAVSLYYVRSSRLADAGVVEYDGRSRTVRYRAGGVATGATRR